MKPICIIDPTISDPLSSGRGGGRVVQLLKDYCSEEISFIDNPSKVPSQSTLVMPFWFPFHPPQLIKTQAKKKILVIFDVIPLKYQNYFPIGIKGHLFKKINSLQARSYDHIITISETSKKDIIKYLGIPKEKISVVYLTIGKNFLKPTQIQNDFNVKPHEYCLYVGDVNWNKNLPNLARAVKLGDCPCVFVGRPFSKQSRKIALSNTNLNPWLSSFREFLEIAEGDKRFIFPEQVSDNDLTWFYKNALCNILVSYDEGFGLSYIEAGHFKTPSILSDKPIFHEIAGDSALFVNPDKPQEIASAMITLNDDKKSRENLSSKTHNRSLFFSSKSFASSFLTSVDIL